MVRSATQRSISVEEQPNGRDEGEQPSQIFEEPEGGPIYFFFLGLSAGQVQRVRERIEEHSGLVCLKREDADVILCLPERVQRLREKYWLEKSQVYEGVGFVEQCIRRGRFQVTPREKKNTGGRPVGKARIEFTAEDDLNLAEYLALALPYPEDGGRRGNNIYKELVKAPQCRDWAHRHTWGSWRNRYNKDWERFDAWIEEIVRENPPRPDGIGQYHYSRRAGKGQRRGRQARDIDLESEEEEVEEELEVEDEDEDEGQRGRQSQERVEIGVRRRRESESGEREGSMRSPPAKRARPGSQRISHVEVPRRGARESRIQVEDRDSSHKGSPLPEDREDEYHEVDGQVDLDQYYDPTGDLPEVGPSRTQRSPTPGGNVRSQARSTQEAMNSQATLVGPVPTQLGGEPSRGRNPMARKSAPYRLQSVVNPPSPTLDPGERVHQEESELVPATEGEDAEVEVEVEVVPRRPQPKPRRLAKKIPSQPAPDAPARNTRSRSRSVEPTSVPVKPKQRLRKAARGGPTRAVVAEDEEERDFGGPMLSPPREEDKDGVQEGEESLRSSAPSPASVGETQEEEGEVEDVLAVVSGLESQRSSQASENSAFSAPVLSRGSEAHERRKRELLEEMLSARRRSPRASDESVLAAVSGSESRRSSQASESGAFSAPVFSRGSEAHERRKRELLEEMLSTRPRSPRASDKGASRHADLHRILESDERRTNDPPLSHRPSRVYGKGAPSHAGLESDDRRTLELLAQSMRRRSGRESISGLSNAELVENAESLLTPVRSVGDRPVPMSRQSTVAARQETSSPASTTTQEEYVPPPNTRAARARALLDAAESRTPYRPPSGTRADELLSRSRRRR
ncbi:hypothetical protein OE88DRAFT_1812233 [Heliocybe sulcata]|uniref:TERF2-interacting telomeric protein 1 Myb domain-containing protein n=1 Tax=Heliocybe sulcata TaxID=5364 RepID=A0A5C3MKI8_9AGAM|nr:hypothetical protein OE88DRAFT_1812233 [Heliocybe sulcata]